MSYAHIHAVYNHFNGTSAERLVLLVYAQSIDYNAETKRSTGVTDPFLTVVLAAKRAGMDPRNVRAVIRRYEGTKPGQVEQDKWFYPVGPRAHQGQVTATRYWMPVEPMTTTRLKRAARNPDGINQRAEVGSPNRRDGGGLPEPTQGLPEPTTRLPEPTSNGSGNLPRTVTGTDKYPLNTHSIPVPGEAPLPPVPLVGDRERMRKLIAQRTAERRSSPAGTPPPANRVGGDAPKPPDPHAPAGMQEAGPTGPDPGTTRPGLMLPDGARELTLDDLTEPTLIAEHQDIP